MSGSTGGGYGYGHGYTGNNYQQQTYQTGNPQWPQQTGYQQTVQGAGGAAAGGGNGRALAAGATAAVVAGTAWGLRRMRSAAQESQFNAQLLDSSTQQHRERAAQYQAMTPEQQAKYRTRKTRELRKKGHPEGHIQAFLNGLNQTST